MSEPTSKRKRNVLSIAQKLKISELLKSGTSYVVIGEQYGIGRLTVADIKKNEGKIEMFFTDDGGHEHERS